MSISLDPDALVALAAVASGAEDVVFNRDRLAQLRAGAERQRDPHRPLVQRVMGPPQHLPSVQAGHGEAGRDVEQRRMQRKAAVALGE